MDPTADYYQSNDPLERVLDYLEKRFKDGRTPTARDLAAVDSFHLRGHSATVSLAESVDLQPGLTILDVGSGPGGTARYLAEHFGVRTFGLDLTYSFSRLAALLSEKTGLSGATASALDLPFAVNSFDGAWMEHVQMNIPDKAGLVSELFRALKPSGFLAMYEVFQTGTQPPDYPLPWAGDPACSCLVGPETMRQHLESAGFHISRWHDCLDDIRLWMSRRAENHGFPPRRCPAAHGGPGHGKSPQPHPRRDGQTPLCDRGRVQETLLISIHCLR